MNGSEPVILLIVSILALTMNVLIGILIANAAQRKGRSWAAFFWLSLVAGWLIMAIVVAAIAPLSPNTPIANPVRAAPKEPNAATLPLGTAFLGLGVFWIIVYYLSEAQFPLGAATSPFDLQNWNILIGLLFVIIGFVLTSVGLTGKSRK
jgi:hypothetical protein